MDRPKLTTPTNFPFPFTPYPIQESFMQNVYAVLEQGQVGIFESPTGTGKSLSLICGSLQWIKDHEERNKTHLEKSLKEEGGNSDINDGLDWLTSFSERKEETERKQGLKKQLDKLINKERRIDELRQRHAQRIAGQSSRLVSGDAEFDQLFKDRKEVREAVARELECDVSPNNDDDIVLNEYVSDEETESCDEVDGGEDSENCGQTQIIYCSRTHSQLTQFVHEVQRSAFKQDIRVTSLASRQNMCINEAVVQLKSLSLINDRCLQLQKEKKGKGTKSSASGGVIKKMKTGCGCPYNKSSTIQALRDSILVDTQDIEELVSSGRKMKSCPYYSSRLAVPDVQLLVVPYNTLLHKGTREASGINLKDSVVIIDEAHNLLDTISSIHSTQLNGAQVAAAYSQLSQYRDRYVSRLLAKNLMYIQQLIYVLQALLKVLGGKPGSCPDDPTGCKPESAVHRLIAFLVKAGVDNINFFKLLKYCEKSQIGRKLLGFVERYNPAVKLEDSCDKSKEKRQSSLLQFLDGLKNNKGPDLQTDVPGSSGESENRAPVSSSFHHIEEFLRCLTNADKNGRISTHRGETLCKSWIKFLLLNPAVYFQDVVSEARAVIVAGGTMQPISEFREQLFKSAGVKEDRIRHFAYGHVIPASNLLPLVMCQGPTGVELDFSYQTRDSKQLLDELGRVLTNLCNIIPGGVVVFFPSYDFEKLIYAHLESTRAITKIQAKKKIFREPRNSSMVDPVLAEYSRCIAQCKTSNSQVTGALLLSVVGGKMSEGINFADDLGRCVIMVGLPYPNIKSVELKEKMDYLNATAARGAEEKLPGQMYYENLCMKSVNQSIGRAIRHREDYASIVLLDHRYSRPGVQSSLPSWIGEQLLVHSKFPTAFSAIRKFFAEKKEMKS